MSDLLALRKVRSKDGLYYTFLPTLSVPFAALASCKKLTDNMSASFFVYSFDEPVSYWRLLLEAAQKSPDQGDTAIDIRNDVATLLVEGRISVMETPLLDPLLNSSRTTIKTSSGKPLKLAGPLSFESNQPSKIKKVGTHDEARQYLEQCDLESPEIKDIYSRTAAAKDPNVPDDMLKNMCDSTVKGEINFVEVMGPKQTSEAPQEFFNVFTGSSEAGLGPEADDRPECLLRGVKVTCSHGRETKDGYLEVVASEVGDEIVLTAEIEENCGSHADWKIRGPIGSETANGTSTSFKANYWKSTSSSWFIPHIDPQIYTVGVNSCTGTETVKVASFPADQYSMKVNGISRSAQDKLDYVESSLSMYLKKFKFTALSGSVSASGQWAEHSDYRAYFKYKISGGFNPLIGLTVRVPFGPTAAIPQWAKKYGDFYFFVEFSGGVSLNLNFERSGPDEHDAYFEAKGEIKGKIGASLFLMNPEVVSAEAAGFTGISIKAWAEEGQDKITGVAQAEWEGLKGSLTVFMFWGIVEFEREWTAVDGGPLTQQPWKMDLLEFFE